MVDRPRQESIATLRAMTRAAPTFMLDALGLYRPAREPRVVQEGHVPRGRHHEMYLSDARRTAHARLRTILRQPVG